MPMNSPAYPILCSAMLAYLLTGPAAQAQQPHDADRGHPEEGRNMALVGYHDLQGRAAYQPVIQRQDGRWIAYVGLMGG